MTFMICEAVDKWLAKAASFYNCASTWHRLPSASSAAKLELERVRLAKRRLGARQAAARPMPARQADAALAWHNYKNPAPKLIGAFPQISKEDVRCPVLPDGLQHHESRLPRPAMSVLG
jgi:hypothetical protein